MTMMKQAPGFSKPIRWREPGAWCILVTSIQGEILMKQVRILLALLVIVAGSMGAWVWKVYERLDASRALLAHADAVRAAALARKDRDQQQALATLNEQHQKEIQKLNEEGDQKLEALRKEQRTKLTQAYQQFSGILDGDKKTLDYINLIEQKVKSGQEVSKAEADKLAVIATGISYLQKQYQKPFEDFRELESYLEKRASTQNGVSIEHANFWQRLFSKEAREKEKQTEREYYRTEGELRAFRNAQSKFANAYAGAQRKMSSVNIDAEKALGDLNSFIEDKRASTQDLSDFFNQARKALNTHQKLLDMEPDISKPVIDGPKP
jgi:hypothetical protein